MNTQPRLRLRLVLYLACSPEQSEEFQTNNEGYKGLAPCDYGHNGCKLH